LVLKCSTLGPQFHQKLNKSPRPNLVSALHRNGVRSCMIPNTFSGQSPAKESFSGCSRHRRLATNGPTKLMLMCPALLFPSESRLARLPPSSPRLRRIMHSVQHGSQEHATQYTQKLADPKPGPQCIQLKTLSRLPAFSALSGARTTATYHPPWLRRCRKRLGSASRMGGVLEYARQLVGARIRL
jgi:hypothetical protein